jgi:hypothetical protein
MRNMQGESHWLFESLWPHPKNYFCLQVFASAHTATGLQHKLSSELANMTQQLEAVECMQQVKLQQLSEDLEGVQQQLAHAQQRSVELHQSWQQVGRSCGVMLYVTVDM